MATVEKITLTTPNGHAIAATHYQPKLATQQTLIISSATGVLQYYYAKFAMYFAEQGFHVFTFDYHGIGDSSSSTKALKKNTTTLIAWGNNDQATIVKHAKDTFPNHQLTVITHSIGGQILGFNPNYHLIDKVIMVASQSGYWKYWKGFQKIKMHLFWYVMIPYFTPIFDYFPAKKLGLFENLPKEMVKQWSAWAKNKDYMFSEFQRNEVYFDNFTSPLLMLSFPRDIYAPKAAVDWLAKQYRNTKLDRRHLIPEEMGIEDVQHFGFFKSKFKDSLWKMTKDWTTQNY